MEARYSVLRPLVGSGDGIQSRILYFKPEIIQSSHVSFVKSTPTAGGVILILASGIYSVSATLRFHCLNEQSQAISNGWGITLNSFDQGQRNVIDMPPSNCLARALLHEPAAGEAQREPISTLSWVGFLHSGNEIRVESERSNPRLYQGMTEDSNCFLRVERLWEAS